jgi:hypothetical protein
MVAQVVQVVIVQLDLTHIYLQAVLQLVAVVVPVVSHHMVVAV